MNPAMGRINRVAECYGVMAISWPMEEIKNWDSEVV